MERQVCDDMDHLSFRLALDKEVGLTSPRGALDEGRENYQWDVNDEDSTGSCLAELSRISPRSVASMKHRLSMYADEEEDGAASSRQDDSTPSTTQYANHRSPKTAARLYSNGNGNGSTVLTQRASPNGGGVRISSSGDGMGGPKLYPVGSAAWRRALQHQKEESEHHLATGAAALQVGIVLRFPIE